MVVARGWERGMASCYWYLMHIVLILQDEEFRGWIMCWLHNNVNVPDATELHLQMVIMVNFMYVLPQSFKWKNQAENQCYSDIMWKRFNAPLLALKLEEAGCEPRIVGKAFRSWKGQGNTLNLDLRGVPGAFWRKWTLNWDLSDEMELAKVKGRVVQAEGACTKTR